MMDRVPKENREFVRTDLSLHATLSPIDQEELSRKRCLKLILSSCRAGNGPGRSEGSDENSGDFAKYGFSDLAEFLMQMNDKLDRILAILEGEPTAENLIQVVKTIDISGSGVGMVVNRSLGIGQLVEVALHIPDFAMGVFRTHGKVMRSRKRGGDGTYEIGIKFLDVGEEERERLISFIFRQQRKNIRKKKNYL
jgi:hypothetical protein